MSASSLEALTRYGPFDRRPIRTTTLSLLIVMSADALTKSRKNVREFAFLLAVSDTDGHEPVQAAAMRVI